MSENKTVFVTGADGFLGSYVVQELLDRGYNVRAGVTDKDNEFETRHLRELRHSSERSLSLFNCDLMDQECFKTHMRGAQYVIHIASPTKFDHVTDPERQILEPARQGNINVLQACEQTPSVKKVVVTSCLSAMMYRERTAGEPFEVTEDMWSDESFLRAKKKWYHLSKTQSEKICWSFMEKGERNFSLVIINPGMTIGPILSPTLPYSNNFLLSLTDGVISEIPLRNYAMVDVRDVACAHVMALEKEQLKGRLLCVSQLISSTKLIDLCAKAYPKAKTASVAPELRPSWGVMKEVNTTRVGSNLGLKFRSAEESIRDTLNSFHEHGLLA